MRPRKPFQAASIEHVTRQSSAGMSLRGRAVRWTAPPKRASSAGAATSLPVPLSLSTARAIVTCDAGK
jgi:hypothetical protein